MINPIMKYFEYDHLPERLQPICEHVQILAKEFNKIIPPSDEKSEGLRKLLEAKDCFVRANL